MKQFKTIAVDFDGTLCKYAFPEIGKPKLEVINFVKEAHKKGHKIIIWTCRTDEYLQDAIRWLHKWKIPYEAINDNINKFQCRKVMADIYLDDRALNVDDIESFNLDTMDFDNSEVLDDIETLLTSVMSGTLNGELDNWEDIYSIANKYGFDYDEDGNLVKAGEEDARAN